MLINVDLRRELLIELSSNPIGEYIDLRRKIKELGLSREDVIRLFTWLKMEELIRSDNNWSKLRIKSNGKWPEVHSIPLRVCLTQKGYEFVKDMYLNSINFTARKDEYTHMALEYIYNNCNDIGSISTREIHIGIPLSEKNILARQLVENGDAKSCTTKDHFNQNIFCISLTSATFDAYKTGKYLTSSNSKRTLTVPLANDKFISVKELIRQGENEVIEFKSTLCVNLLTDKKDSKMELAVLKTIASFLNTLGGSLIIGIADDGSSVGIQKDGFKNEDKMSLHLIDILKSKLGILASTNVCIRFEDYKEKRVMVVSCKPVKKPVFVNEGGTQRFYIRIGPSTRELQPSDMANYIIQRNEQYL